MFINYAHRGASEYAAQNTLAAFYLGLACQANGIETDIRRTADGKLILFHDKTLDATTNGSGLVSEHNWEELRFLTVYGKIVNDRILTFEEFLERFSFRDLQFAIELKQKGLEEDVSHLIYEYSMQDKVIITSFSYEFLKKMRDYSPKLKIGWLTKDIESDTVKKLKSISGQQICPKAELLNTESVAWLKSEGFSVRAWGVSDTTLMENCVNAGVDGMTVNFPDLLYKYLEKINT